MPRILAVGRKRDAIKEGGGGKGGQKWRKAALRIRGGGGGNVLAAIECHGEYEGGGMGE